MKAYSISDIHGYLQEFEAALKKVDLTGDNILVLLGDFIHYGPDSYGVLDKIFALQAQYGTEKVIALMGNHEEMALDGTWNINEDRFGVVEYDDSNDDKYLSWMSTLPRYHVVGNAIFVHAGIDEEAAAEGYWELGTCEHIYTSKFPAETGRIANFDMKIVAGHVGTSNIADDPHFHDIFFDGGSHYYVDGTVQISGEIPVLMYDTEGDKFYSVTDSGLRLILPYDEET